MDFFEYGNDTDGRPGNDHLEMYKDIIKLHKTLQDWFQDIDIYHYLGYLFAHFKSKDFESKSKKITFKIIWDEWNEENMTRNDFKVYLRKKIKEYVFGNETKDKTEETGLEPWLPLIKETNNYNWFEDENKKLIQILILLDP